MEFCSSGSLIDIIKKREKFFFSELQIIQFMGQIIAGLEVLHSSSPPIAHRDLKIENILVCSDGTLKLCDFGSCTSRSQIYSTSREIVTEEEIIGKYSTAMYRAPEMADLYKRQLVNEKVDIWVNKTNQTINYQLFESIHKNLFFFNPLYIFVSLLPLCNFI
jgi:AP2-associated kinase